MGIRLTFHAKQRLQERTALNEEGLFNLIRGHRCVNVGIEPYTNRLHKLIYSEADKTHFVVIHDVATDDVITILPLDYHENLAWKISEKKLKQAVFRISPKLHRSLYQTDVAPPHPGIKCSITLALHSPGLQAVHENFGSHRFVERPADADDALGDPDFVEKTLTRFRERNIPLATVEEILLYDTSHDFLLTIPWDVLEDFYDDIEIGGQAAGGLSTPLEQFTDATY